MTPDVGARPAPRAVAPTRFADGAPMLLAGLRRHHAFATAGTTIPAQWEAFRSTAAIPWRPGATTFGVVCGSVPEAGTFEYMAGVEVATFEGLAADVGRMRVPAQRYAVFTHEGDASTLHATWTAIWDDWLPGCGLRPADTPDFERYDARVDPATGRGTIEIWFPVAAPGQAVWTAGRPPQAP